MNRKKIIEKLIEMEKAGTLRSIPVPMDRDLQNYLSFSDEEAIAARVNYGITSDGAILHIYVNGIEATIDWVRDIKESFLQELAGNLGILGD